MKKITLLILLLGLSLSGFSQVAQNFGTNGLDSAPTVLTINSSDVTVNGSDPITEISLGDFTTHYSSATGTTTYCGDWYAFDLSVVGGVSDGTSIASGCDSDFNGIDVTGFTTITITSNDIDNWSDTVYFDIDLMVTFTVTSAPLCDAVLTETEDVNLEGDISWSAATGLVDNYDVTVGTASGLSDVYSETLGNVLTTNIGALSEGTTYYVTITPSNTVGVPTDCTEQSFTTLASAANDDAANAIALTLDEGTECGANTISASNFGTSDSGVAAPSCGSYGAPTDKGDLWYTFVAPASGALTLNTSNLDGLVSVAGAYYSGTVGSLVEEGCTEFGTGWPWDISGLTSGETYYLRVWDYGNDEIGSFDLCGYYVSCTSAEATVELVEDCSASTFVLNVTFSTLGDATEVSDGTDTFTISGSAAVAGPYAFGTSITLDVVHSSSDCDFELGTYVINACAPTNNDCAGAQSVTQETEIADVASATATAGTIEGATASGLDAETCGAWTGTANDDVWYSFEATTENVNITYELNGFDGVAMLYSGTCGALTVVDCADNGTTEEINATGLTVGETYYTRIYQYGTSTTVGKTFDLKIWSEDEVLGVNNFETEAAFSYYPNPVKNTLSLNAQNTIEHVAMYNMLGQEVLRATPNTVDSDLDMSHLQTGTYFVKVTIANVTKTIRVIKQ
ncbi:T9SS type A sorting domain-containing protein [Winogradskyella psychrotolerans]|uniref:T9SS type A sorting domain-containing protein n=1 Tax=Winogradskyella psychrotolerans TaxID=1344585 RepID=UPI001C067994|nr:T9SS type A sorting domain-containing protein [Winogradskyella psychrotolerans]MBU2930041.1 T9SS type A sorting domain-containing protein [Winogradskyella psychrotolerans]